MPLSSGEGLQQVRRRKDLTGNNLTPSKIGCQTHDLSRLQFLQVNSADNKCFFISKTCLISSFQMYTSYTDDEERSLQPVWKKYWVLELIMISNNPLGILGFVWHHTWHQLQPMRPKNVKCRHPEDARYDPSEQMRPLGTSREEEGCGAICGDNKLY